MTIQRSRRLEEYKYINENILDDNVIIMSLIIMKVNYGAIYDNYSSLHGYFNIKFSSSP